MQPTVDRANPFEEANRRSVTLLLLDDQGCPLTSACLVGTAGRTVEVAVERKVSGRLLAYLYGRGRRRVTIETDGIRLPGRLTTSWYGHRRWFVELGAPHSVTPSVTASVTN
jgi:hypothetical protein